MKFKSSNTPGGMLVELGPNEPRLLDTVSEVNPTPLPVFKLKTILVPVDFSACSLKALRYAEPLAKQFGAQIVLVHVVELFAPVPEINAGDAGLIQAHLRDEGKTALEKLRQELDPELGAKAELRVGNPWMEVIEAAKTQAADLIVVSTHGRTGFAHVFLGSVAERIVRHAGCPVLVVRENEHEFVARPAAANEAT